VITLKITPVASSSGDRLHSFSDENSCPSVLVIESFWRSTVEIDLWKGDLSVCHESGLRMKR